MRAELTFRTVPIIFLVVALTSCSQVITQNAAEPPPAPTEADTATPAVESSEAAEPTKATESTDASEEPSEAADGSGSSGASDLPSIYDFSRSQELITTFAQVVERLDLVDILEKEGPITAFIPTNNAFSKLPSVVTDDDQMLFDIIRFHLVEEAVTNSSLLERSSATSVLGEELTVWANQYGGVVENANLLGVTDQVSNGIIYVIDRVMLPPTLRQYGIEQASVAGEETLMSQGNLHIDMGARSPIPYNSIPPTSGSHYPNIVAWQIYDEPIRYEHLVHNMEDAGVIIYYQCVEPCPDLIAQLSEFVQPLIDNGRHIVMVPNQPGWTVGDESDLHQDMGSSIAVTAWQKLLKLDEFDASRINDFIQAYEGIDHHARY